MTFLGSEQIGFYMDGEPCGGDMVSYGNTAHGVNHGFNIRPMNGIFPCTRVSNFFIWKAYNYGIYFQIPFNILITNVILSNSYAGVYGMLLGPPSKSHRFDENKEISIRDSVFVGRTDAADCATDVAPKVSPFPFFWRAPTAPGGGRSGIVWTQFMSSKYHIINIHIIIFIETMCSVA